MNIIVSIARKLRVPGLLKVLGLYGFTVSSLAHLEATLWRRRASKLYSQFIKRGDLAFDVGANRGTRVSVFRKLGARVIAVEPQQQCVEILKEKYGDNGNVICENIALGAIRGTAQMMIQDDADVASTLSQEFIEATQKYGMAETYKWKWEHKITVNIDTLDNLIAKYGLPSFCKIDVEGYEYQVLMGLSQSIPALSIEFHPLLFDMFIRNIRRLVELGFVKFNYSMGETMRFGLTKWVDSKGIIDVVNDMPREMQYGDIYTRR